MMISLSSPRVVQMNGPQNNKVAIVDYGLGNLFSVKHACEHVGLTAVVTADVPEIMSADAVILPGVGAFGDAMQALKQLDLVHPLRDIARSRKPLVGICLGMQLLMTESDEFGRHQGLGIIDGAVRRLEPGGTLKVPQVGWNRIFKPEGDRIDWSDTPLAGVPEGLFVYFVHSFYIIPEDAGVVLSVSSYGDITFCSSLKRANIFACQFHPERSGTGGLSIYRNIAAQIRKTQNDYKDTGS